MDFIRCFLDRLHEELKIPVSSITSMKNISCLKMSSKNEAKSIPGEMKSIISKSFGGILKSQVECLQCKTCFVKEDVFFDLSIQISSETTVPAKRSFLANFFNSIGEAFGFGSPVFLEDCLQSFCQAELLDGGDKYWCEKCRIHVVSRKTLKIERSPEILCVQLKRFKHEGYFSSKINTQVLFPLEDLDLNPFLSHQNSDLEAKYDLFGIISHRGSFNGGHYVSYCKNYETGQWFEYDDSHVTPFTEKAVASVPAYILFYRLRSAWGSQQKLAELALNLTKVF